MYDTREQCIEDLKKNTLFEEDKNLTSGVVFYVRKNTKLKEAIEKLTGLSNCREAELVYKLVHPEASKYCEVCGKEVQFSNYYLGYKKACCKKHADILSAKKGAETKQERYGDSAYNNKEKSAQTKLERYGNAYWTNTEKACQTRIERYGTLSYNNKEQYQQTCMERYGVKNPTLNPEVREKQLNTFREKYGVSAPMQSELVKQHYKQNCVEKRGCDWPFQDPEWRKKYLGKSGKTKNEEVIAKFLEDSHIKFKYEYKVNKKNFDFAIFDENNQLTLLIETDGAYAHNLFSDPDSSITRKIEDYERFSKVPEGVKFLVFDASSNPDNIFKVVTEALSLNYEDWIQKMFESLPEYFPYPEYSKTRMKKDYKKLQTLEWKKGQRLAESLIKYFHKSLYEERVGENPSPKEAWEDKNLLRKCIKEKILYYSELSSQLIIDGFITCKYAPRASFINPSQTRRLILKYLSDSEEIFNPNNQFSGIMLGVASLNKKYIGWDESTQRLQEAQDIVSFLKLKNISFGEGSAGDCLFTSVNTDDEIDKYLKTYKCKKYLFIVDDTERYIDKVVEKIPDKGPRGSYEKFVILI